MAAAEVRAAWQRAANRCFVQEDAKRAPKLACCPSSPSSSKPQVDIGAGDLPNGPDHSIAGFIPLNWNISNSNLPPDSKWWLQLQPNFGYQKDFTCEQLNALETELEVLKGGEVNKNYELGREHPLSKEDSTYAESGKNADSYLDSCWQVPATCAKLGAEAKMRELKAASTKNLQEMLKHKDIGNYWFQDEEMDFDPSLISEQPEKLTSDSKSPWMGAEKTEPWWRAVDKDDLASLVAQKSLEHIENCDLPRPQTMHVSRGPFVSHECFNCDKILPSYLEQKTHGVFSHFTDFSWSSPTSGNMDDKKLSSGEVGSLYGSEKPFSSNSYSTTNKNRTETRGTSDGDLSKAQLLEALCHSQTRAREAEKAAQKAYTEKEHILKLFFRQASYLFAYKQWFQLLQLETLCLQLNKGQQISTLFPVVLPWMPCKARQLRKGRHKAAKRNRVRGPSRYDFSRYAFAFALGLSLAGAGLLLGWTMGWLLPTF
ncbi:PREDICTED: uncharacterized protein LOC104604051 isoform X2 [Nelumbo nucifera]|uniref:Uncharacterized protein LOC104604051 isoform X2 n=1 Tax=Nelumbo nucifera TaxID=4432 RepID=A0A1U8AHG9_NELNU|nr:PREDICTED: uncharacterized protein LOC104604051 isoform X2 [Nelumbo nucifera]